MRQAMNQERKADAAKQGVEPDLVPQCEHLWVVSGVSLILSISFFLLVAELTEDREQCRWYANGSRIS